MNDHEIVAAALRWHKAYAIRLIVSSEKRREKHHSKQQRGYAIASSATAKRHSEARRLELAALRALSKVCASVRTNRQDVTDVVELLPMLAHDKPL